MTRQQVINYFGGSITQACDFLGYSRHTIYRWRKGIPLRAQIVIEKMTDGGLKAQKRIYK